MRAAILRLAWLLVFTVIVRYERPGHVFGVLQLCVDAATPTSAARVGRTIARSELKQGVTLRSVVVRADGCFWMPGDAPGEYRF